MNFNVINEQNSFGNHVWHILMTHLTYLDTSQPLRMINIKCHRRLQRVIRFNS